MRTTLGNAGRWMTAPMVAVAMAFGARAALAAPAAEARGPVCVPADCTAHCIAQGGQGGICNYKGICLCFV